MKFSILLLLFGIAVTSAKVAGNRSIRIVGGIETGKHEFPSMLNIGYHFCGAALIKPKWALTAAQCLPVVQVVGGDHLIDVDEGTEVVIRVIQAIPHPSYGIPRRFSNDVALLELASEFILSDTINTIPLAPRGFNPTGNSVVIGWGMTENGVLSNALRKVTVPLVSNAVCTQAYGNQIEDSMICAGAEGKDSCRTDSGGPMFCDDNGRQVHCGVVSWGRGCGETGYPGVYARTSEFRDFIEEATVLSFD